MPSRSSSRAQSEASYMEPKYHFLLPAVAWLVFLWMAVKVNSLKIYLRDRDRPFSCEQNNNFPDMKISGDPNFTGYRGVQQAWRSLKPSESLPGAIRPCQCCWAACWSRIQRISEISAFASLGSFIWLCTFGVSFGKCRFKSTRRRARFPTTPSYKRLCFRGRPDMDHRMNCGSQQKQSPRHLNRSCGAQSHTRQYTKNKQTEKYTFDYAPNSFGYNFLRLAICIDDMAQ